MSNSPSIPAQQTLKVQGERVALKESPPETEINGIALPTDRQQMFFVARVMAVGDGRVPTPDGSSQLRTMHVKAGDDVFMQAHPSLAASSTTLNGSEVVIAHQNDIIAKVTAPGAVTLGTLQPVGNWLVVHVVFPSSVGPIILPEISRLNHTQTRGATAARYYAVSWGANVPLTPEQKGVEVVIEKTRATPFKVDGTDLAFLSVHSLLAVFDGSKG